MPPSGVMGQPSIMVSYQQVPAYGVQTPMYSYPPTVQNAQTLAASRQSATPPVHHGTQQSYPLPSQTPSSFGGEVPSNIIVPNNSQPIYAGNMPQQIQPQAYNPNMGATNRFVPPYQPPGKPHQFSIS